MKNFSKYMIPLVVGAVFGFAVPWLSDLAGSSSSAVSPVVEAVAFIVAMLIGAYLQIVLHEAGHLVCGLLSGYRFVSFRVGSLTLIKDKNGKLRFKRFKVAGTGGQCLMSPPDVPVDKLPTRLYNAGGALMNFLCATVSLLILLYCDNIHFFVKYFLAATVAVGYLFALLNGIPLKFSGISNDGYNILYLKRDKKAVKGFYSQLVVNEKSQNGIRYSQMPEDLFDLGGEINYSDPLQSNVELMRISRVLDQGDIEQAHNLYKELIHFHQHELLPLLQYEVKSELLFTCLATGETEHTQSLVDDKRLVAYITKYARMMTSKQRTIMAKTLVLDGDREKARQILEKVIANHDKYLMQGEVDSDIELMKRLLEE